MDWQGQKVAEQLMKIMLLAFAVGYVAMSFRLMLVVYSGGVVLTALVTIPYWPLFNRRSLKWVDPLEVEKRPEKKSVSFDLS